ncbi:hypothetical protein [Shewanella sp. CG12_big_fil_rev_8_21_14_0_65_47_15]|uniref:hypothetical protein n=1 Tax=Shewanella sp. CG12_big_fil_rev_8_21_14_0_65_47_15 TaxID=1975537 RepID=UPI002600EEFF|nr:hypothetical protein [Shewanella sp. CG12_big_fil_rev_8_21_14_0_65_47_15]
MPRIGKTLLQQLQTNLLAMISLVVALSSLSYNTWRNEQTEANRNQRTAAFEMIHKLNELQEIVFYLHYDKDIDNKGNPRRGWVTLLTIKDLAQIMQEPIPKQAENLALVWQQNWESLEQDKLSLERVTNEIDRLRHTSLNILARLK